jgi:hypothetical protein
MNEFFETALPMFIVFGTLAFVVKTTLEYRMRRQLIEKGLVDDKARAMFAGPITTETSIKWGMVMIGVGLAILLGEMFPYSVSDEITVSLIFLFSGIGLIVFYLISPWLAKRQKDQMSNQ